MSKRSIRRRRSLRRAATSAAVGSITVVGVIAVGAGPAAAACPHGGNNASISCTPGTAAAFKGAQSQFHNNNMYMAQSSYNSGAHINNETWFYTQTDNNRWVETGLRNGYDGSDPCQYVAYEAFWADFDNTTSPPTEIRHTIQNTTPDGTNHVYEVLYHGNNQWDVYRDFNFIATSKLQQSAYGKQQQAGLEISAGYTIPGTHADTFNNYMQTTDDLNTWANWPSYDTWIDNGCNNHPQGYCMNGVANHTYEWSDNKP